MHKSPHFPSIEKSTTLMVKKIIIDSKAQDMKVLPVKNEKCVACMGLVVRQLNTDIHKQ